MVADYEFSPALLNITVAGTDQSGANFTVTAYPALTIGGRITTPAGVGLSNVTVSLAESPGVTGLTDANGNYTFSGITPGVTATWTVTVNTADPDFISQPLSVKGLSGYYNGYTTLHFKFGNFLIEPGVRYDHLEVTNNGALAPRATASYTFPELGKGLTIFGSGGDLARFPQTTVFNKETGNPDLRFEKVRKVSAGFEQKFNSVWQVTFEVCL